MRTSSPNGVPCDKSNLRAFRCIATDGESFVNRLPRAHEDQDCRRDWSILVLAPGKQTVFVSLGTSFLDDVEFYLCGPPMMLQACLGMFDDLGIEEDKIAFDDFGS